MTHPLLQISERMVADARRAKTLSQAIAWIREYPNTIGATKARIDITPTYAHAVDGAQAAAGLLEDLVIGKLVDLWSETLAAAEQELATLEDRYRPLLNERTET